MTYVGALPGISTDIYTDPFTAAFGQPSGTFRWYPYIPPFPFRQTTAFRNPTITGQATQQWSLATEGGRGDTQRIGPLAPFPWVTQGQGNYSVSYVATQVFGFRCKTCHQGDPASYFSVVESASLASPGSGPAAGPHTITRVLTTLAPDSGTYTVSKAGYTATTTVSPP